MRIRLMTLGVGVLVAFQLSAMDSFSVSAQHCVQSGQCVAINPTLKCCDHDKMLHRDDTKCHVNREGHRVGGAPMRCMSLEEIAQQHSHTVKNHSHDL